MPSFSDTITKVWCTHTIMGGAVWEWIRNAQPANAYFRLPPNRVVELGLQVEI
jgi:K+ transporter